MPLRILRFITSIISTTFLILHKTSLSRFSEVAYRLLYQAKQCRQLLNFAQLQMSRESHDPTMSADDTPFLGFASTEEIVETFRAGGQAVFDLCGDNSERWTLYHNFLVLHILFLFATESMVLCTKTLTCES